MTVLAMFRLSWAPLCGFSVLGLGWGSFAAAVPALKTRLGVTEAELGIALFCAAVGAILAMSVSPRVMERIGTGPWAIFGVALTAALAFTVPALATTLGLLPVLAVALFGMGAATGTLDVVINARVSALEARNGLHLMSLNHGMFSLVYAIAAFLTGLGREAGAWPAVIYLAAACAIAALALLALLDGGTDGKPQREAAESAAVPLPRVVIWVGVLILIAFFAENATEVWSALHIEQTLGGGAAQGALGPTLLGLTMALGRFSGQALSARFGITRLMAVSTGLAAFGALVAATAPGPAVAYVGFAALGLGVSTLAPLGFALGGRFLGDGERARGIARITLISYAGFFFGPPVLGVIAQGYGLRAAFAFVALMLATLLPIIAVVARTPRRAAG